MIKRLGYVAALIMGVLLFTQGCATSEMNFAPASIDAEKYIRKVDQFVIIADGSQTMADRSHAVRKMEISQNFLTALNESVPELGYEGSLRTFGKGSCDLKGKTVELLGPTNYTADAFARGLRGYECAGGGSPLDKALAAAGATLTQQNIPTAIVVVSDGRHMGDDEVEAARKLKNSFGDNLNIYAIQVGHDKKGGALLARLVKAGGNGYVKADADLTTAGEMEQFVTDVFLYPDDDGDGVPNHLDKCPGTPKGVEVDADGCPLDTDGDGVPDYLDKCPNTLQGVKVDEKGCPVDSDGDGVPDYLDKCPNTPKGVTVDKDGCPVDSDGDGVPDYLDKCPGTPKGVPVDATGCPLKGISVIGDEWVVQGKVLFDTNKNDLKAEAKEILTRVADFMRKNPQYVTEIQGHTDSTGSMAWNMKLSQKRAETVKAFLVDKGVGDDRLVAKGYGPNEPLVANDTRENRVKNRRVDFKPTEK